MSLGVLRFIGFAAAIGFMAFVTACGARVGRDLSIEGASELFDRRRAANRAAEARLRAKDGVETPPEILAQLPVLPPRQRVLQVRVPAGVQVDDVADSIISSSQHMAAPDTMPPSLSDVQIANEVLRLENQIRNLDTDIETLNRTLRGQHALLARYRADLDFQLKQQKQARELLLQEFKLGNEKQLQGFLSQTETAYTTAQPATILGLTEDEADIAAQSIFGRARLGDDADYVSLDKDFVFYGGAPGNGIAAGRLSDLADNIGTRNLQINLNNLRIASAIRSLARSLSLSVYLSPQVEKASARVRLEIAQASVLDVLGIIVDTHALALVYDRKAKIARFYTADEFAAQLRAARAAVEAHNRRARRMRTVSDLESDQSAILTVYRRYFQQPDAEGRRRSIDNDAILEANYSANVSAAIVVFKERALANERALAALDQKHKIARAPLEAELEERNFAIEDINFDLNILLEEKKQKNILLAEALQRQQGKLTEKPKLADKAPAPKQSTPPPVLSRENIIEDSNLATSEPIYTAMFTVYNNEGANSCEVGDAGARAAEIKKSLDAYFQQIYPDNVIAAEQRAEERMRAEISSREAAEARARRLLENGGEELAVNAETEAAAEDANDTPPDAVPAILPAADNPPPRSDTATDYLENSDFRRPTTFSDNGNSIVITGFKRDLDLAASLIEELDRPKKQVLVEVFMVNVIKNWRRELQGRIANAFRDDSLADPDLVRLNNLAGAPSAKKLHDGGRVGVEGELNFGGRGASGNLFKLNDFKLGLAWTLDFMEENSLGRQVSSPTILAIDGCAATISKTTTRTATRTIDGGSIISNGVVQNNPDTTEEVTRPATLNLTVTPRVNVINNHVRLDIAFVDSSFIGDAFDADQVSSNITTKFNAAPGDVIVLAGLFSENNAKLRNGLPGATEVPLVSGLLGTSSDQLSSEEMVIFLAPTVITPQIGSKPVNSAEYINVR